MFALLGFETLNNSLTKRKREYSNSELQSIKTY